MITKKPCCCRSGAGREQRRAPGGPTAAQHPRGVVAPGAGGAFAASPLRGRRLPSGGFRGAAAAAADGSRNRRHHRVAARPRNQKFI